MIYAAKSVNEKERYIRQHSSFLYCSVYKQAPHKHKVKYIKLIIFTQIGCFPVFKRYIRNSKQLFLKHHNSI